MANGETVASSRLRVEWSLVVQIIAWVAGAVLTYGVISGRVAVLESRQGEVERRLDRIELKIDRVLENQK